MNTSTLSATLIVAAKQNQSLFQGLKVSTFLILLLFSFRATAGIDSVSTCIDSSKIDTNAACYQVYAPVCGCDGKTYGNDCFATAAGVISWTNGGCWAHYCNAEFNYQETDSIYFLLLSSFGDTTKKYLWSFGDGTFLNGYINYFGDVFGDHLYKKGGPYTVCLKVFNAFCADSMCQDIYVSSCRAHFGYTIDTVKSEIVFKDSSIGQTPAHWLWEFGDGTTSTLKNPVFPIDNKFKYMSVQLTIWDSTKFCSSMSYDEVYTNKHGVYFNGVYPDTTDGYSYCLSYATVNFSFDGFGIGYNDEDTVSIYIKFGDGKDTTVYEYFSNSDPSWFYYWGRSKTYTYTSAGKYNLQYIVTAPDGKKDTAYGKIIINDFCGDIGGKVYFDANTNCVADSNEVGISGVAVVLLKNNNEVEWAFTDEYGYYEFYVQDSIVSTYQIKIGNSLGLSVKCPVSGIYTVSTIPSINDFALGCRNGFDLLGDITGWRFRPGFDGYLYLNVKNARCTATNGQVKLVLDSLLSFVSADVSPTIKGDTLIWSFNNLAINSTLNKFLANIVVKTSTSALFTDSVCVQMFIEPLQGDSVPQNNVQTFCFPVRNSWDPNDKIVSPAGDGVMKAVLQNTSLTYTINFQNTGTDTAYNIFILDTLDSDLDVSSFQMISSSHTVKTEMLQGNVLKFTLNNIMLADSNANEATSHGFVKYSIQQKSNLSTGTNIQNKAEIYFDYNPAVVTNTVKNTIVTSIPKYQTTKLDVEVYPNPFTTSATIYINSELRTSNSELRIYDLLGRELFKSTINNQQLTINRGMLTAGVYFLKVNVGGNVVTKKLVVMN